MSQCPCSSGKTFSECCEVYLSGEQSAPSAEALMRSRYTAFTKADIDYIAATHHPQTKDALNISEVKDWALNSTWIGLEILSTQDGIDGDVSGKVEFMATYNMDGSLQKHHELSDFDFLDGKWYFTDGKLIPVKSIKVGRNEPCPCESGKKFKKCCGS